ncbi:MAG: hypothetical protein AB8V53_06260 [Arsenophonus endosymbiont of Dermacentor nuttalli]
MLKVNLIKINSIQPRQNGTCSLDDIIKEKVKNNKILSGIDLSKNNDVNLLYDDAMFYDCKYTNDVNEDDELNDTNDTNDTNDILIKNEEIDHTIVDKQFYNISLKLSVNNLENIKLSNHSLFKDFTNEEPIKNDKFSNQRKYISKNKISSQINLIKYENSVIKNDNINNTIDKNCIINLIDAVDLEHTGQNKQVKVSHFHYKEMDLTSNYAAIPMNYKSSIEKDYHNTLFFSKKLFDKQVNVQLFEISTDKIANQKKLIKYENSVIKKDNIINYTIDKNRMTTIFDAVDLEPTSKNKQIKESHFNYKEMDLTSNYAAIPMSYKSSIERDYHNTLFFSKKLFDKQVNFQLFEDSPKSKSLKINFINIDENRELKYYFNKWGKTHYVDISINKKFQHSPLFSFYPSDTLVDNRINNYLNNKNSYEKNFFVIKKDKTDEYNEKYQIFLEDEK